MRPWGSARALLLLLTLIAGCGDGNGGGGATETTALQINLDEHAFAADPALSAEPGHVVSLRLENPEGNYADDLDTGDEPGVDVIPYRFRERMEREFCWETDPGAEPPPDGEPAYLLLRDDAGRIILRVEQDGACVRETIPAGRYTAELHHGASQNPDRDVLFILPRDAATAAKAAEEPIGEDSSAGAPLDTAPTPYCPFVQDPQQVQAPTFVIVRQVDQRLGQPCPPPVHAIVTIPYQPFFMKDACTDLALLRNVCTYVDDRFYGVTLGDTKVRVYADVFFRGPRKTLVAQTSLAAASRGVYGDLFSFDAPGSLVPVRGEPAANRDILIRSHGCDSCDLTGVDLAGVDLRRTWLRRADLSHANLTGAKLTGAWADGTFFKSAHLVDADLSEAYLGDARFDSAGAVEGGGGQAYPGADLTGAALVRAWLFQADLRGATLDDANLTAARLDGANFGGASATRTVFRDVTSTPETTLRGIRFDAADFTGAMLRGATLTQAVGSDVILIDATLSGANLRGAVLPGANLEGAKLDQALLGREAGQSIAACQLSGAYMANVDLSSADATGVNLHGARFYGRTAKAVNAILTNADMVDAELSGVDFTGATLQNATLDRARCINCKFNNARLAASSMVLNDGAKFNNTRLEGADFTQATVSGCVFTDAGVSFGAGSYRTGVPGEIPYVATYGATKLGELRTSSSVICPDALPGPCNTRDRLLPRAGTPTPTVTRTATPTNPADPLLTPTP
jgi:uncharacterized protein YjbI with pentapeptide repeats